MVNEFWILCRVSCPILSATMNDGNPQTGSGNLRWRTAEKRRVILGLVLTAQWSAGFVVPLSVSFLLFLCEIGILNAEGWGSDVARRSHWHWCNSSDLSNLPEWRNSPKQPRLSTSRSCTYWCRVWGGGSGTKMKTTTTTETMTTVMTRRLAQAAPLSTVWPKTGRRYAFATPKPLNLLARRWYKCNNAVCVLKQHCVFMPHKKYRYQQVSEVTSSHTKRQISGNNLVGNTVDTDLMASSCESTMNNELEN